MTQSHLLIKNDALQRFGRLKVEATSFTTCEPVDSLEVSAMLYNLATEEQRRILETVYDVTPYPDDYPGKNIC